MSNREIPKLNFSDYKRILIEGDSLSERNKIRWPYLRMMNWDLSWGDELEEAVFCWRPDADVAFLNNAVGGSCIKNLIERLDRLEEFSPDIVLFTLGTNDPNFGISPEEYRDLLKSYLDRVNAAGAKAVMMGGMKKCPNYSDPTGEAFTKSEPYFEVMEKLADDTGNYYLNIGDELLSASEALYGKCELHTIYSDGVHFNQVGAKIIAGAVLKMFGILN